MPRRQRQHATEPGLERQALRPLVVDRAPPDVEVADRRRPLVRHHDGVAPVEHGGHHGDGRDDAGDRHVAVEEPELGRPQHLVVDGPLGPDDGQAGHGGRPLDGGEAVAGAGDDEQGGVGQRADELDRDDRVDAPAERDERALGRVRIGADGGADAGPAVGDTGRLDAQVGEVEAVAVGELAEPVEVHVAQEVALGGAKGRRGQLDHRRRRRLVVRHAGEQEHPAGRGVDAPGRPTGRCRRRRGRGTSRPRRTPRPSSEYRHVNRPAAGSRS